MSPAFCCSILPNYESVDSASTARATMSTSPPPVVTIEQIVRGHKGEIGDCAYLGWVVLKVPREPVGFRFEIVEGSLNGILPEGFVRPTTPGTLGFFWGDAYSDAQEPIRVVISVTSLSKAGFVSRPLVLTIQDPGRAAAR
jgi:hypothetical protein